MAKKNNLAMDIIETIGVLRGDGTGWSTGVYKIGWGDQPTTLDIRKMNASSGRVGRGVSLSDEEAENLTHILLDAGYGTVDKLKEVLRERDSLLDYGELINQNEVEIIKIQIGDN